MENSDIAAIFPRIADILELQESDVFRIRAYRNAALTIQDLPQRILRAMDNRHVTILSHPTGRLIGTRPPYEADWERIFRKAKE